MAAADVARLRDRLRSLGAPWARPAGWAAAVDV